MRIGFMVGCILVLWDVAICPAGEPQQTLRKAAPVDPRVREVLREASKIALKQDEHHHYWTDRVLLHIGEVQIRARDFDDALKSIRGSNDWYGRNSALVNLAKVLARDGQRERASEILRFLRSDHGWRQDYLDDGVQLRWIEHLIASGDLDHARKAVEQVKSEMYRPDGLRMLAVGYAKSGDAARASEQFALTVDAAENMKDEFDRAKALGETADAQLTMGQVDAAKATIGRLVEKVELKDPWAKLTALKESAVLAAKANDEQTAQRLFRRAIEAQKAVNAMNKINGLKQIAVAQAGVGYIDDALETASIIKHSERDFTRDGRREEALFAIAVAQLKANDTEGAVRTALSVEHYVQYRDDSLHKIVDHQIAQRNLKTALTTAEKIENPSRKAAAILKVATAHAKSGDRKMAADVAARIELTQSDELSTTFGKERFDYRLPRTWGACYDAGPGFTIQSHLMSVQRAAEVAAEAMELAQALAQKPTQSYAIFFNEINNGEVTEALARAHAASGDASEALAWAKQIGSSGKVNSNEDHQALWAIERRIHALIGAAEGILDRSSGSLPGPQGSPVRAGQTN